MAEKLTREEFWERLRVAAGLPLRLRWEPMIDEIVAITGYEPAPAPPPEPERLTHPKTHFCDCDPADQFDEHHPDCPKNHPPEPERPEWWGERLVLSDAVITTEADAPAEYVEEVPAGLVIHLGTVGEQEFYRRAILANRAALVASHNARLAAEARVKELEAELEAASLRGTATWRRYLRQHHKRLAAEARVAELEAERQQLKDGRLHLVAASLKVEGDLQGRLDAAERRVRELEADLAEMPQGPLRALRTCNKQKIAAEAELRRLRQHLRNNWPDFSPAAFVLGAVEDSESRYPLPDEDEHRR